LKGIALQVLEEMLSEDDCSQPLCDLKTDCNMLYGSNQQGLASHRPAFEQEQIACQHLTEEWNLCG